MLHWLGCTFTAKGLGSIPSQGTKIPQATCHSHRKTKQNKTPSLGCQAQLSNVCMLTILYSYPSTRMPMQVSPGTYW